MTFELFHMTPPQKDLANIPELDEALRWIADQSRKIATAHMDLANKAENAMNLVYINHRFRTGLRTFARYHCKAASTHLEMAKRAHAALHSAYEEFDLTDVTSA